MARGWSAFGGGDKGSQPGGQAGAWKSEGLEFDTKGIREFTTEIGKAEKGLKSFVGHFKELDRLLKGMDDSKIKALAAIGNAKGISGGNGGDVSFTPAKSPQHTEDAPASSGDAARGGSGQSEDSGKNTSRFGGMSGGVAGAYFMGELIQRAGSRISANAVQTRQTHGAMDYANVVGQMRGGGSYMTYAKASSWNDLYGVTGSEDATAMVTGARMRWGAGQGGAGQKQFLSQIAGLNAINPAFGGAANVFSDYTSAFTSPQAQWSMIQQGLTPAIDRGQLRNPNQVFEDMILRASGKRSFDELSKAEATDMFGWGGQGRQNLGVIMPGMSSEMTDSIALLASTAAGGRGISGAMNTSQVRNSIIGKEFDRAAQETQASAVQTRKGRDSTMNVIEAENWLAKETDKLKNAFAGLTPIITGMADKLTGVLGAGATAGAFLGDNSGEGGGGAGGVVSTALGYGIGRKLFGGAKGAARGAGGLVDDIVGAAKPASRLGALGKWAGRIATPLTVAQSGWSTFNMDDSAFDVTRSVRNVFSGRAFEGVGDDLRWINDNIGGRINDSVRGRGGSSSGGSGVDWGQTIAPSTFGEGGDPVEIGDPGDEANVPGNLDPSFSNRLRQLFRDAPFRLAVTSGLRSSAKQKELYQKYLNGTGNLAAKPGTSKHEKGHAVDISVNGGKANSNPAWRQWISANAGKYGLRHGGNFSQAEWWHLETPGTVSESGGTGTGANSPTPPATSTAGGGGFGAKHKYIARGITSTSNLVKDLSASANFKHSFGSGGGAGDGGGIAAGGGVATGGSDGMIGVLRGAGFSGEGLRLAYAVMMGESQGNPRAHNPNAGTGDNSYGLFQINMLGGMGPERRKQYGLSSNEDLFNPQKNAEVAFKMSGGGSNWQPWSAYKNGSYKKYYRNDIGDPLEGDGGGGSPLRAASGGGGGTSVSVGKIVVQSSGQLTDSEATRLAQMVLAKIESEAQMKTLGAA